MILCPDGEYEHPTKQLDGSVLVPVDTVRRIFEGKPLARAQAVATLRPVQVERLFPGAAIQHARNMRRIGRRLTGARILAALADASFHVLLAAAAHEDEDKQFEAAARAIAGRPSR